MPIDNADISKQDKARLRRIKLKLRHLTEELEQAEDLKSEYEIQFQAMISQLQIALGTKEPKDEPPANPKDDTSPPEDVATKEEGPKVNQGSQPPHPNPHPNEKDDADIRHEADNHSSSAPPWMKKLYKQIALRTHPDKIAHLDLSPYERAEYSRIFETAKSAVQDGQGGDLLYAAELLGIDPEIPTTMRITMLVTRGENLKQRIHKIYKAPSWIWCESYNNRGIRKKILEGFCSIYKHTPPSVDFFDKFLDELEAK